MTYFPYKGERGGGAAVNVQNHEGILKQLAQLIIKLTDYTWYIIY